MSKKDWISIEDRLPKEGQRVIAYFNRTGIDIMRYHNLEGTEDERMGRNLFTDSSGFLTDDVTHWMSLPEPPKE